ncbi:SDR family oxidoreductase [Pseudochryseolinea flava]|uniref:Aldehyde reductase n=1 Tax=Pseudochryseolinea flava TaxID=2059302 RepID=A0A364XWK7_9BACT|nr:aldehyde reductase [Pseudochryseolinea flava]RAV98538.1 aldehyde reductase [Pseudochryseolinea flava]
MKRVLLTGVTGFLGSHTAIQLLNKGYTVIGTLRDHNRTTSMKDVIARHTKNIDHLTIVEAELNDETIWHRLMRDIDYVQHIASPFPRKLPKHEDELIVPAKAGTLNILKAAAANGVSRVVMTSSVASIVYGKKQEDLHHRFNENDWTNASVKGDSTPYFRSKTIAEKAAWEFIKQAPTSLELVTVLPGAILGPVLEQDFGTSANIVMKMLDGSSPALPKLGFDIVDVRSVADLLIRAMELPQAANNRYIASSGYLSFKEVAEILKRQYPKRKIPSVELPNFVVKLFSRFDPSIRPILIDLGKVRKVDNTKAKNELGWNPLPAKDAIISCAESVFNVGLIQ